MPTSCGWQLDMQARELTSGLLLAQETQVSPHGCRTHSVCSAIDMALLMGLVKKNEVCGRMWILPWPWVFFLHTLKRTSATDCLPRKAYLSIAKHLGRKCIFIPMTQLPLSWRLSTMGNWGLSTFTFLSLTCLLPPYPVTSCPIWSFLGLEHTTQRYYQQRNLGLKMRVTLLSCSSYSMWHM